jgi:hypothetical protein
MVIGRCTERRSDGSARYSIRWAGGLKTMNHPACPRLSFGPAEEEGVPNMGWWVGLLASPGGLLIIGAGLAIILVTVMVAWKDRR